MRDFNKPNGIAFSPDESKLYVVDTGGSHSMRGEHHIRVFSVDKQGGLSGGDVFAEVSPGLADGLRVDLQGNIWTSAGDGVHCYAPDGVVLGKILVPEPVSNLTFGGPKRNRIFITATTSLYAVYVAANGAQRAIAARFREGVPGKLVDLENSKNDCRTCGSDSTEPIG